MSACDVVLQGLFDLRAALESAALRQACRNASDEDIAELTASWATCKPSDWTSEAEEVFQLELARISGNARLHEALWSVYALLDAMGGGARPQLAPEAQAALVDALQARDLSHGRELRGVRLLLSDSLNLLLHPDGSLKILFGRR
ncbi:FCD domain-containing protein [Pseudomonas sp. CR3202]|uniref:FCD domain-containing protein n=1 Tax=Pseudomonas sp. CR3202 TaxID=3351532 RepID=UPI003BF43235